RSWAHSLYKVRYAGLAILAAVAAYDKAFALPDQQDIPQGRYGLVFQRLAKAGFRQVRVIDGGVQNSEGSIGYTPQLRFYYLVWTQRGMHIRVDPVTRLPDAKLGEITATCDESLLDRASKLGPSISTVPDCAAIVTRG
ncbi:MAG TPA: hypothetical protein VJP88_09105, partial [Caulobacteraceae bacterium]|nr:hypothetical protein [Caulobacteraceae bacterium]